MWVGVRGRRGVTSMDAVDVSTGARTDGVGKTALPVPHARINNMAPAKKNKSFANFICHFQKTGSKFPSNEVYYFKRIWLETIDFIGNQIGTLIHAENADFPHLNQRKSAFFSVQKRSFAYYR